MGMVFIGLTLVATTNIDERDAGVASGLFNTTQQMLSMPDRIPDNVVFNRTTGEVMRNNPADDFVASFIDFGRGKRSLHLEDQDGEMMLVDADGNLAGVLVGEMTDEIKAGSLPGSGASAQGEVSR